MLFWNTTVSMITIHCHSETQNLAISNSYWVPYHQSFPIELISIFVSYPLFRRKHIRILMLWTLHKLKMQTLPGWLRPFFRQSNEHLRYLSALRRCVFNCICHTDPWRSSWRFKSDSMLQINVGLFSLTVCAMKLTSKGRVHLFPTAMRMTLLLFSMQNMSKHMFSGILLSKKSKMGLITWHFENNYTSSYKKN